MQTAGKQLHNDCSILTISHSSYVRELILNNKKKIGTVCCLESAPQFEGRGLVDLLTEKGISAQVVPDNGYLAQLTRSTHMIVGADLISNLFFINKAGTKELAECAVKLKKEIWILGDELRYVSNYQPEKIPVIFEIIPLKGIFKVIS